MEKKDINLEELLAKVEGLEQGMKTLKEENQSLKAQNQELAGKIASVKVEGLVKQVEEVETPVVEQEEITFDFDL